MQADWYFAPFRIDGRGERLWRDTQVVALRPKTFATLRYLVEHAGQLVTKDELLNAVWPDTVVSDAVLKVSIGELREALGDQAKPARFIETVHRRGYRFLATVTTQPVVSSQEEERQKAKVEDFSPAPSTQHRAPLLVGREVELAQLHHLFVKALNGERQVVFVTGDAGIGKTALVEAFVFGVQEGSRLEGKPDTKFRTPNSERAFISKPWIARGQCMELYGAGEAYLPVLQAIGQLCGTPGQESLVRLLEQHAPTWLLQLPAIVSPPEHQRLQQHIFAATPERMLREIAEAIEVLTSEIPLILLLEDLHWSDYATLDLLATLARRQEPARLLVIGTYRPIDVIVSEHPLKGLKRDLQLHGQCEDIALESWTISEIGSFLATRFSTSAPAEDLLQVLHRQTGGNPLFLVHFVEYLLGHERLRLQGSRWDLPGGLAQLEHEVPENIRHIIERQFERLSPDDQRVLEAASVVGLEFTAALVDAALEVSPGTSEERCDRIVQQQRFLVAKEPKVWPDGTISAQYAFSHSLYTQVFTQRVTAIRQVWFHRRIGECLESAYGTQTVSIAADLAHHFEHAKEYQRTVTYLRQAATTAARRYANRAAVEYLNRARALVERLPPPTQVETHMTILHQLAPIYRSMGDMQGAADSFAMLAALAHARGQRDEELQALLYSASALSWVDRERSLEIFAQVFARIPSMQNGLLRAHARGYYGYSSVAGRKTTRMRVLRQSRRLGRLMIVPSCYCMSGACRIFNVCKPTIVVRVRPQKRSDT